MNQWWNDTNKGKPMYQDTTIHPKLFSGSAVTCARTLTDGCTAGMIVISVWTAFFFVLYTVRINHNETQTVSP